MEQLRELMNLIISKETGKGFKTCSELLEKSEYVGLVKNYLAHLGFNVSKMSFDNLAILFFGLLDVLIVVKDNDYYFATLSSGVVDNLRHEGRLLPREDDNQIYDKTFKMMQGQTFESIGSYLDSGKFKLIKLAQEDSCSSTNFLCRAVMMNPYPTLSDSKIYVLSDVAVRYNNLVNSLLTGVYNISTTDGDVVCTCLPTMTDGKALNFTCTSCKVSCRNLDRLFMEIPFWKIKDYNLYEPNEIVAHLMTGIYRVRKKSDESSKGFLVTMSREILTKFYGNRYLRLESIGVRQRYAYEDMLSLGFRVFDISYFYRNYYFYLEPSMKNISSYTELVNYLKNVVVSSSSDQYNGCMHPRVLGSYSSILNGHAPFYITIKNTDDYIFESVNPDDVLPKLYYVGGTSKQMGYVSVQIESPYESNVSDLGKAELERQFGEIEKILGIYCVKTDKYLKGRSIHNFGTDIQRRICEKLRWGYGKSFSEYAPLIREICLEENITYNISDDAIKYLFVNNLARKCSNSSKLSMSVFGECLADFLDLLKYNEADSKLEEELKKLSRVKLKKYYDALDKAINSGADIDKVSKQFNLQPDKDVLVCKTQYGVLTVKVQKSNKLLLLSTARLMHGDKDFGTVRFQSSF